MPSQERATSCVKGHPRERDTGPARRPGAEQRQSQQQPLYQQLQQMLIADTSRRVSNHDRGNQYPGSNPHAELVRQKPSRVHIKDESRYRTGPETRKDMTEAVSGSEYTESKEESLSDWRVYQYHVDFIPDVESSRMRQLLLKEHEHLFGRIYLFDGISDVKSFTKLKYKLTEVYSEHKADHEIINISIKKVKEFAPTDPEMNRLFNTQMRKNLSRLKNVLLHHQFFNSNDKTSIKNYNLFLWHGVLSAIQEHKIGMTVAVDTVCKVLHTDTVLDQMRNISRRHRQSHEDVCIKELFGCIVMTGYNNRTYRIEGIEWTKNPADVFETSGGKISLIDYYKKLYNRDILDRNQPLLICKAKQKEQKEEKSQELKPRVMYLIPELCIMTGLSDDMQADLSIMKWLTKCKQLNPDKHVQNMLTCLNKNKTIQKEIQEWDIKLSPNLATIDARVIKPEKAYHQDNLCQFETPDFAKEMRGNITHASVNLYDWVLIAAKRDQAVTDKFLQDLKYICPKMGMKVFVPTIVFVDDDSTNSYLNAMKSTYSEKVTMMVIIVPNYRKDRYDAIKKLACLDYPVPSQVIIRRALSKKLSLMSAVTKIGIQLNCKFGGEAWTVHIPMENLFMVIGFGTYHDPTCKGYSVSGFVASLNKPLTRWYSQASIHRSGRWRELSNSLSVQMNNALKRYHHHNRKLPSVILLYRDDVPEGQFDHVREYELKQIKAVLEKSTSDNEIKLGFIIVNKRISTHLLGKKTDKFTNPSSGTIADSDVTKSTRYDFFLVSQSIRQGAVAPTHYSIIFNESGLSPEQMQRLTYKLTHLYFNWPGTIRTPAPCQYAHKLAYLTGQSLQSLPNDKLTNKLFYL